MSSSTQSGLVAMMVQISSLSTLYLSLGKQFSFLLVEEFLAGSEQTEDLHLDPGRNQLLVHLLAVLGPVEGCHILELQQVWGPGPLILQM